MPPTGAAEKGDPAEKAQQRHTAKGQWLSDPLQGPWLSTSKIFQEKKEKVKGNAQLASDLHT